METSLHDRILERLFAEEDLDALVLDLVDGACQGPAKLEQVLAGARIERKPPQATPESAEVREPPGAYLDSITVAGFRGVGPVLLTEVHRLIDSVPSRSEGVWARSAALLTRQALETAVRAKLDAYSEGLDNASFRAQLLCLQGVISNRDVARDANYLWAALSSATHHSGYELAPTVADLRAWVAGVERVVAILERRPGLASNGRDCI